MPTSPPFSLGKLTDRIPAFLRRNARHAALRLFWDAPYTARLVGSQARACLQRLGPSKLDGRPVVVFHEVVAKHRAVNQSKALRSTGRFQTVLLTWRLDWQEVGHNFDEVQLCLGPSHLPALLARLAARAPIHSVICSTTDIRYAAAALEMARSWPVLVSVYDSYWARDHFRGATAGDHRSHPLQLTLDEKAVLPRCDGVIGRFGDIPLVFADFGVTTPLLVRWDLCDSELFQPLQATSHGPEHEWSCVVAGLVFPMAAPVEAHGEGQMVRLAPDFRRERVHLHVYPSPHEPFYCPEYLRESRENPYFHLHPSVSPREAPRELTRHELAWMAADFSRSEVFGPTYIRTYLPLRAFGYLEAGLPILCTAEMEALAGIVTRYGCGLALPGASPIGLRALLARHPMEALREGVEAAREALRTERHAGELVGFLEELRERLRLGPPRSPPDP